jgi:hypothetical protein
MAVRTQTLGFKGLVALIMFGEEHKIMEHLVMQFLHHPVASSLLAPCAVLNTLFSKFLNLRYFFAFRQPI